MSVLHPIFQHLDFKKGNGLLPVIVQDYANSEVLMLAYTNEEALQLTLSSGFAHYYTRSRKTIWKKGDTSGHFQKIKDILFDCDNDTLLFKIEQIGGIACHTGRRSCFFNRADASSVSLEITQPIK